MFCNYCGNRLEFGDCNYCNDNNNALREFEEEDGKRRSGEGG